MMHNSNQKLIHIKDIINNKEFIYDTECNLESGFFKCFESIVKTEDVKEYVKYAIYDNYCEIYYEEEIIKKGWVWNSKKIQKHIIYILTYIPIYKVSKSEKKAINEVSTQTQFNSLELNFEEFYNQDMFKKLYDVNHSITDTESSTSTSASTIEEINNFNFATMFDLEPIIENFNNLNLGNGYAPNPFFPRDLQNELKDKISKPNNGLRRVQRDFTFESL